MRKLLFLLLYPPNFAVAKTCNDYIRQLKRYIEAQVEETPNFKARHWIRFQSANFMPLGNIADWIPKETRTAHAGQKISAYKVIYIDRLAHIS